MIDGGHMIVPSIGQTMPSSTKVAISSATDRSGKAHIVPITWQKMNKSTNATYFVSIRPFMGLTKPLKSLLNAIAVVCINCTDRSRPAAH